jgi:hypothetical protein
MKEDLFNTNKKKQALAKEKTQELTTQNILSMLSNALFVST